MQDTINSIRVTLNERIGNPFISATIISCIFINWKLSLLLFSDVSYDSKVEKIIGLYPDISTRLDNFLIYPICFGLFWTFIWPAINLIINTYWYWMKSNSSNLKLKAERKKKLSEPEAAELYSTIDAQESRYLEFLKDRQNKIEDLSKQISGLMSEHTTLQNGIERYKSEKAELESTLSESQRELSNIKEALNRANSESDVHRRALDDALSRSIEFAEHLPGLKAITNAINQATNHQANETWILEEFNRQEPSFPKEEQQKMLSFFLGLGLIKRESNGNISFGERYRYTKDKVLGVQQLSRDNGSQIKLKR